MTSTTRETEQGVPTDLRDTMTSGSPDLDTLLGAQDEMRATHLQLSLVGQRSAYAVDTVARS